MSDCCLKTEVALSGRLPFGKRVLFSLFVAAIITGLVAAAGELRLRWSIPAPPFSASLNLHTHLKITSESNLHGVSSPIRHSTNKWGMRGSDPPEGHAWDETTTIVTVGGSTTQCFYLDDTRTWAYIMEQKLLSGGHNVWVGNVGQDGHSTRGNVLVIDKVVSAIRPDYALFLVGVNDLALSLDGTWETGNPFDGNMTELALGPARSAALNRLLDHSRLAHRLYQLKRGYLDGITIRAVRYQASIPTEPLTELEAPLPAKVDDILPSLPLFRSNVLRLIRMARAIGVTPVFLTQPLLFEDNERWRGIRARMFWIGKEHRLLSGATYAHLLDRFNHELLAICAENDVACFDLAREIPHSDDFFYDMVHFNDAGAQLVGAKVAMFLAEHSLPAPLTAP